MVIKKKKPHARPKQLRYPVYSEVENIVSCIDVLPAWKKNHHTIS